MPRPIRHIGFIGSVIPSKGVHVLCAAFARLNRPDLVLHLHGETPSFHGDTGYVERLRQMIPPHLGVQFHGRYEQRDLPRLLAALDLLVVPSLWWESYCLTAREGALAGLPVVASRLGALEEAIADGIAIGFTPGDSEDLNRVLARILATTDRVPPRTERIADLATGVARMEDVYDVAAGQRADVLPDPT
jgi:glycosyltransferase involved in cell wall biosynthesis